MLALFFLATLGKAVKYPCDTDSCPSVPFKCVGLGEFCWSQADYYRPADGLTAYSYAMGGSQNPRQWDWESPCGGDDRSECAICTGMDVICHQNMCTQLTQELAEPCCTLTEDDGRECHKDYVGKYCKSPNECEADNFGSPNGTCVAPTSLLQAGDPCVTDSADQFCGSGLSCIASSGTSGRCFHDANATANVCTSSDYECPSATFCNTQEGECQAKKALGDECMYANDPDNLECGWKLICSSEDGYTSKCIERFSKDQGMMCSNSNMQQECKKGLYCNGDYCDTPDTKFLGEKYCLNCGRGLDDKTCPMRSWKEHVVGDSCQFDDDVEMAAHYEYLWTEMGMMTLYDCLDRAGAECQADSPGYACYRACVVESFTEERIAPAWQAQCEKYPNPQGLKWSAAPALSPVVSSVFALFSLLFLVQ